MKGATLLPEVGPRAESLAERVRRIFATDAVLHEAVARGWLNYRALSRWLISAHKIQASEDAVLSAIRRLKGKPRSDPFRGARQILAVSHLNVRSRVCQVMVPKSEEARRKLAQLVNVVDFSKGEMLYFTWGEFGLKILVDESNLPDIQALFGPKNLKATRNLAGVTVVQSAEGLQTPGILALLSQSLALHGINVLDAVYGYPDYTLFVAGDDAVAAYQALEALLVAARQATGAGPAG